MIRGSRENYLVFYLALISHVFAQVAVPASMKWEGKMVMGLAMPFRFWETFEHNETVLESSRKVNFLPPLKKTVFDQETKFNTAYTLPQIFEESVLPYFQKSGRSLIPIIPLGSVPGLPPYIHIF